MCVVLVSQQKILISLHNIQFSNGSLLCSLSGTKSIAFVLKLLNGKYFLAPLCPFQLKPNLPLFSSIYFTLAAVTLVVFYADCQFYPQNLVPSDLRRKKLIQ